VFFYDIFHNDSVNRDIPSSQNVFIDKFLSHKLVENVFLLTVYFRQEGFVHIYLILQRLHFLNVFFGGINGRLGDEARLVENFLNGGHRRVTEGSCEFLLLFLLCG
jgi:hypothetical protein